MTAPAVAAPVSPAAPAPAAVETTPSGEGFGSALDRIIKTAPIPENPPSEGIPAGGVSGPTPGDLPTRAEVMGAVPAAGSTTDGAPVPATEVSSGPTGEVKVDDPDGEMVMSAERNADGTFKTQIDPNQKFDIKIKDKLTGETKTYSKNVPELLRLAKDGLAVQKVHDELGYYRKSVPEWERTHNTLTTTTAKLQADLEAQMQLNRELLTAPDEIVIARRNEFAQEMSPEKKLARLEAQIKAQEEQKQQTAAEQQRSKVVTDFATARLAPILAAAEQQVGSELVKMKLALDLVPFQVNGSVPPERLVALETHLRGPFTEWVKQEAAKRNTPDPAIKAAEEAARKTQLAAQVAVNATGRSIAPVTSVSHAASDPQKAVAPPKNVNEAIERIINKPIMATR